MKLIVLLVAGAVAIAAAAVAITLAVTGGGTGGQATERLTRAEWKDQLVQAGVSPTSDFDTLEDLAREDCERDADSWAISLSLQGAQREVSRLGLEYLCPDKVEVMKAGQDQLDEAVGNVDEACNTPAGERTEEQEMLAEAMRCD